MRTNTNSIVTLREALGQQCEVYRNLHTGGYSVRHRGKVVGHARAVMLRAPRFVVQPGGRARVLREKRKNVHAFARGELVAYTTDPDAVRLPAITCRGVVCSPIKITYNPYTNATFVTAEDAYPVQAAAWAFLGVPGVWVYMDVDPPVVLN